MDQLSSANIASARIHVALTFNDRYWALAYTVMRSICLTTKSRRNLVFHLCHTALAPEHAATLQAITTEFGATLAHYDPEANDAFQTLAKELRSSSRFPPIVYARLILDRLLPKDIERVIYLDCDVMVCRPIDPLYAHDMGGKPVAAVLDPFHILIQKGFDISRKQTPFDTGEPYFNSGVMLIDLRRYAETDIPGRIRALASDGLLARLFFDQDILNLIFAGNWQPLDWRYNLINPLPAHETLQPVIVHYTAGRHPWRIVGNVAFRRIYRHVMTNDIYYRYLAERSPRWLRPLIDRIRRHYTRAELPDARY